MIRRCCNICTPNRWRSRFAALTNSPSVRIDVEFDEMWSYVSESGAAVAVACD